MRCWWWRRRHEAEFRPTSGTAAARQACVRRKKRIAMPSIASKQKTTQPETKAASTGRAFSERGRDGSMSQHVQRRSGNQAFGRWIHEGAEHGTSGGGQALPHLARIQRAFGRHDLSRTSAHQDPQAMAAARAMGARAYTIGEKIAFAGAPTLHTAAHEAAHVVQQRAGV